ncbi:LytTR family DNA-binding domain-containing protein [Pricia sp. S334]|uniref:LytTR family DNA-binding domain-containing protein n=1 Tax=Pricia mediterranea TaxID=3076079 RepID=A0ABU3L0Z0_9FLAO|nr:LytTR family DNA-binding domain-containing protein [Pricia sp. S334]MDT7827098.1 LytTR family DNA-binding domain-containing protein [Pricia sp. S334]
MREPRTLNTIVIDDSKMQRTAICTLVRKHPKLELTAEYKNGIEARIAMKEHPVDLVFLDIEMPIISGFDFIESLKERPQIILITGNPDYAMQAFDYDVTDYLLKPITAERFDTSVKKALANRTEPDSNLSEDDYIVVSSKLKKVKVPVNEIQWVEGVGDYIKIVTEDEGILVLMTMKSLLETLPDENFMRIHKSYIVNLEKVENFSGSKVEISGQQLPLSRHKKAILEEALINSSTE